MNPLTSHAFRLRKNVLTPFRAWLIWTVLLAAASSPTHAAEAPKAESASAAAPLHWIQGPAVVPLLRIAQFRVPESCVFLTESDSQQLLGRIGETITGQEIGFLAATNNEWLAVIKFLDVGFIPLREGEILNAADFLRRLKAKEVAENAQRREQGRPQTHLQDWDLPPTLDPGRRSVEWSILNSSPEGSAQNFVVSLLGRSGVIQIHFVDKHRTASALQAYREVARQIVFNPGERYTDTTPKDRMASSGLLSLVSELAEKDWLRDPQVDLQLDTWMVHQRQKLIRRVMWILIGTGPVVLFGWWAFARYQRARRHLQRLKAQRRSPSRGSSTPTPGSAPQAPVVSKDRAHPGRKGRRANYYLYHHYLTRDLYHYTR